MEEVQEISNESDKFVQEVDNLNDQLSNDRNCDGGIKSLLKEILNQIGIVIDEIRNLNLHLKELINTNEDTLGTSGVCQDSCISDVKDDDMWLNGGRSESRRKATLVKDDCTEEVFDVKVCSIPGCGYIEKKTNNNMKHHYVIYHDELTYPLVPFSLIEMSYEEYTLVKTEWLQSESRKEVLRKRKNQSSSYKTSKRMRLI